MRAKLPRVASTPDRFVALEDSLQCLNALFRAPGGRWAHPKPELGQINSFHCMKGPRVPKSKKFQEVVNDGPHKRGPIIINNSDLAGDVVDGVKEPINNN